MLAAVDTSAAFDKLLFSLTRGSPGSPETSIVDTEAPSAHFEGQKSHPLAENTPVASDMGYTCPHCDASFSS